LFVILGIYFLVKLSATKYIYTNGRSNRCWA
jgi:hypothetical protein